MNLLDVLALLVLAASGAAAMVKGWMREAVALGAILLGLGPAFRFCHLPGELLQAAGLNPLTADVVGAFLILIVFLTAGTALSGPLACRWAGERARSGRAWLGAVLGVIRGSVLVVVAFTLLAAYPAGRQSLRESGTSRIFLFPSPVLSVLAGGELGPALGYAMDRLQEAEE